jgi:hypothetical protein
MLKPMAVMAENKQEYAMRKILPTFAAVTMLALVACADNSQAPVTGAPTTGNSGAQHRTVGQYMLRQLISHPGCNQYVLGDRIAQITLGGVTLPFFWESERGKCPRTHPMNNGPVHVVQEPLSFLPNGTRQGSWVGRPHYAMRLRRGESEFCRGEAMPIACPATLAQ